LELGVCVGLAEECHVKKCYLLNHHVACNKYDSWGVFMEVPAPIIDLAVYEKRLRSISTQLDPRERSLVLRFAQDLLLLGTELYSPPNGIPAEIDDDLGLDSDLHEEPLEQLRLFHQTH
jgi:hypothetical protein